MAFVLINCIAFAQSPKKIVKGKVIDAQTQQPIVGATVSINNTITIADSDGNFSFEKLKSLSFYVKVTSVGYSDYEEKTTITENEMLMVIRLKSIALFLQPLEVKSIRASDKAPFTKTNLSKEQISKVNLGQDLPFILNQTPSVVVNADAGNGVGYTGIRIRGTDATRINVTLNGIPYNDAESQGTFFVNLPDFTSSANSIQVQRGVGTSTNGTGAFGATINLSTNEFIEKPYAELNNSFGSFNTWKNTVKAGTGLIDGHYTVDARLSQITSDGFIERAASNLQAFYLSGAYINKKSSLRLNIFSGKEKTYQAWNGVPEFLIKDNRTYNSSGTQKSGTPYDNETDNYKQTHYQLFFNNAINDSWSFNTAAFLTRGFGYYENYKADEAFANYGLPNIVVGNTTITKTDLVRQLWLDNHFYGQIFSFQRKKKNNLLTIGGGWSNYDGKHYGKIIWANTGIEKDYTFYNLTATKSDINLYAKIQHQLTNNLDFFVDVQYKNVQHKMNGFRNNPTLSITRKFDFINPKMGITYSKNGWQTYFSYALAGKEPNRDDFEAEIQLQPNAETLHDFELGTEKKTNKYHIAATAYYMLYKNQLVLTGKVNDVGAYTRNNVANSYRLGLEMQAGYVFTNWFNVAANVTLSNNKINEFTEFYDDYDNGGQVAIPHTNTTIAFSPTVVGGATFNFIPCTNLEFSALSKYVSKQYLDNTQNNNRKLNSFYTQDIRAIYTLKKALFKECNFIAQVNNVFNKKYEPNGYTYSYLYNAEVITENFYYPMAGTNFMLAVNIKL